MGKVSKRILDEINAKMRKALNLNQWRNTKSALDWFNNITEKEQCTFMVFDIINFYPSISKELLEKSLIWAKRFVHISDLDLRTIMHCRKSLLFDPENKAWAKKDAESGSDVTMGSYDGAEICELVGLFILDKLNRDLHTASIGLYRDDGLAILRNQSGTEMDNTRKTLHQIFKSFGLKITASINLKSVNFLDVTMNLSTGSHAPYRKPNDEPLYINVNSNHPPSIIKQSPHCSK